MNESDPRSNVHYLGSSENKAWVQILYRPEFSKWQLLFHPCKEVGKWLKPEL